MKDGLRHGLRLGKLPAAVENLLARSIHQHEVVPTRRDRDAIGCVPAWLAPELHRHRAVGVRLGGDVIHRVHGARILLEESVPVVDADRPAR